MDERFVDASHTGPMHAATLTIETASCMTGGPSGDARMRLPEKGPAALSTYQGNRTPSSYP